jgi:hypothetical protein
LGWKLPLVVLHIHATQFMPGAGGGLAIGQTPEFAQAQLDVVQGTEMTVEGKVLKDETNALTQGTHIRFRTGDLLATKEHLSRGGVGQAIDTSQQG